MDSDPPLRDPDPLPQPDPKTPIPEAASPFEYRGNGHIARLPKHIRDQVNTLDALVTPTFLSANALVTLTFLSAKALVTPTFPSTRAPHRPVNLRAD